MYVLKFMLAWTDVRKSVLCRQHPRSLITGCSVCAYACLYVYMNISVCVCWLLYKISNLYQQPMQREIENLFKVSHPLGFNIGYLIQRSGCYSVCCMKGMSCRHVKCVWRCMCRLLCVWNETFSSDDLFEISHVELWLWGIAEDRRNIDAFM
jgi:hypothetical protein